MSIAFFSPQNQTKNIIAVIGLGLIGQAVAKQFSLSISRPLKIKACTQNWSDSKSLVALVQQTMANQNADRLELVWCAGKAGFSSGQKELDLEHQYFEEFIVSLRDCLNENLVVNLISSAGGLYENSNRVTDIESLAPIRPYAIAKLAQEQLLIDYGIKHRIYRVSSVYGLGGNRLGLISVMLRSAINRQPMTIYANQNTLRDYILNTDIAKTICNDAMNNCRFGIRLLASGRATSVDMLLNMVHRVVGARPVHSFQASGQNDRDIVFSPKIIYSPSQITSLEEGIRVTAKKLAMADYLAR